MKYILFLINFTYSTKKNDNTDYSYSYSEIVEPINSKYYISMGCLPYDDPAEEIFPPMPINRNNPITKYSTYEWQERRKNKLIQDQKKSFSFYFHQHYNLLDQNNMQLKLVCLTFILESFLLPINEWILNGNIEMNIGILAFSTPIILSIINYLSFYTNKGIFFIKCNPHLILFPDIMQDERDELLSNAHHSFTAQNQPYYDRNYFLYKLKSILSPMLNIVLSVLQLCYILIQFLVLSNIIDYQPLIGLKQENDIPMNHALIYLVKLVSEVLLIIYNIIFWWHNRLIHNITSTLCNSLIFSADKFLTSSLCTKFISFLI